MTVMLAARAVKRLSVDSGQTRMPPGDLDVTIEHHQIDAGTVSQH
jgi:hypothetical protein